MTLIDVLLTLVFLGLVALVAVCVVGVKRLTGAIYDRQVAMDKVFKETTRHDLRAARAAEESIERANLIHEDARQLLERVERHVSGR